ncbi:MAG TPA: hypothetical protein HA330_05135 [Candidatus Thalassarchaeaceae archaeon]|nr:MAG TPA: hypothetical protein D7H85_05130 [Candidatus Poseidoniales archaeon]HII49252.1 hypothetical protein [Candidatus Thalassarchaeaceae archaeon]|tara:strand:+ start:1253 stop:2530 length:1278 start_codon:yes stop_codon:yes gene_type:complete
MTESEVEGASLPTDGIDVDETSAYFGVTQTSDLILRLNETDRLNGLGEFLTLTSDLLLTDQFDFDVVSERLGCESGEIYYLFAGPFGILTMTDPLRLYLGQQDSEGNEGTAPDIPAEEIAALDTFNDPFRILKLLAVGHTVGGIKELDLYIAAFEEMVVDPSTNRVRLIALKAQLDQVLDKAKTTLEVSGLSVLSMTQVASKIIRAPEGAPPPKVAESTTESASPNPVEVVTSVVPDPVAPTPESIPSPQNISDAEDALAAAFSGDNQPSTNSTLPVDSGPADDALASAFSVPAPAVTPDSTQTIPVVTDAPVKMADVSTESVPPKAPIPTDSPTVLAPSRAPIGSRPAPTQPSFGQTAQPTFGALPSGVPSAAASPRPAGTGKVRNAGAPGIRATIQTGVFCASCGIGVEHHWRHCPLCSNRLI